jgi:hypothetical protein
MISLVLHSLSQFQELLGTLENSSYKNELGQNEDSQVCTVDPPVTYIAMLMLRSFEVALELLVSVLQIKKPEKILSITRT